MTAAAPFSPMTTKFPCRKTTALPNLMTASSPSHITVSVHSSVAATKAFCTTSTAPTNRTYAAPSQMREAAHYSTATAITTLSTTAAHSTRIRMRTSGAEVTGASTVTTAHSDNLNQKFLCDLQTRRNSQHILLLCWTMNWPMFLWTLFSGQYHLLQEFIHESYNKWNWLLNILFIFWNRDMIRLLANNFQMEEGGNSSKPVMVMRKSFLSVTLKV